MKLLCFQAKKFYWKAYLKTLPEAPDNEAEEEVENALVIFFHAEKADEENHRTDSILRHTLKHIKWLANKRGLKTVVFHSFSHLGGENASPVFANAFIHNVTERLRETAYVVRSTPFGYFCEWELSVYGDSLAKVWKEIH